MSAYTRDGGIDEFAAACDCFQELIGALRSESTRLLEHGAIESLIACAGKEVLRLVMQGSLDRRSAAEEKLERVTGADGEERRHCRLRSRVLMTLFGEVTVKRLGYSGARLESIFPLDAALNLPPDKYSQGGAAQGGVGSGEGLV